MLIAQPLAVFRVRTPYTVLSLICSNDVQVELYRLEQPPLDDQVMPAARKIEVAWECVSLVSADACSTATTPGSRPTSTATTGTTTRRSTDFMGTLLEIGAVFHKCPSPESYWRNVA